MKGSRGSARASTGSSVALRRRGSSSSGTTPQRGRHLVINEGASRSSRGGRSGHVRHLADSSSGPRVRRTVSDAGSRDARRSSSGTAGDKRTDMDGLEEKKESNAQSNTQEVTNTPVIADDAVEPPDLIADGNQQTAADDRSMSQFSLSEDEDGEDFDYYEDDLEEVGEEDEVDYVYQFQQSDRRRPEENEANIVIDVDQPAGEERGTAHFTDVFYEYLGLGRWMLVVRFHLLRSKEDPRGNLYREIMLQLNDSEWHDIDNLADRLTASGRIMRPEERSHLRLYLDAARHNRPLRETSVQEGSRGPDPQDLTKRLQEVQEKQRIEAAKVAEREQFVPEEIGVSMNASAIPSSNQLPREEKSVSVEPSSSIEFGEQSTEYGENDWRVRSHLETPMSEMGVPDVSASRSRADSRLQNREARVLAGQQMSDSPRPMTGESTESGANGHGRTTCTEEREFESEDDVADDRHFHHHHYHTHSSSVTCQNPLEPLNKFCPFCDKCDYLLVDGPVYLRSPCYHCRVMSAEKEGLSGEQLYRLHTQNRIPWPLYLQKYYDWPPLERVTNEACLAECLWRSRVVCVCTPNTGIWPPCVEFPWLYNPPQNSLAHQMQLEQMAHGLSYPPSLQPLRWCQHLTHGGSHSSGKSDGSTNVQDERLNHPPVMNVGGHGLRSRNDPELTARTTRRSRSLTVGANDQQLWRQLLLASQTSPLAAAQESTNLDTDEPVIEITARSKDKRAERPLSVGTLPADKSHENLTSRTLNTAVNRTVQQSTADEASLVSETGVDRSANDKKEISEQVDAYSNNRSTKQ